MVVVELSLGGSKVWWLWVWVVVGLWWVGHGG